MNDKTKKSADSGLSLPLLSTNDLRGRQSVRASFRLTERAIDTLSILSSLLGIKQKSLFDHMAEDAETLNRIAKELKDSEFEMPERIQKTFVISRKTLECLKRISVESETPRDFLVEYSLKRLIPVVQLEREKHEKRKEILEKLTDYVKEGQKILETAGVRLGEEDPVYQKN